jgi:O-acetyl-ADP-ribose deacetylase (regulator of RNase III)
MGSFKEIEGNLIDMALDGEFNLIGHGANCFCKMGSGIAKEIAARIPDAVRTDNETEKGDIKKLGNFTYGNIWNVEEEKRTGEEKLKGYILNLYTQYNYGTYSIKVDYEALTLCMRKINKLYKGYTIGLNKIGAGLAGGNWDKIKKIIQTELVDMDVTIVHYKK